MTTAQYLLTLSVLACFIAWQFMSGVAYGVWWWRWKIFRQETPRAYWCLMVSQAVIWFIVFATGRTWHVR